MATDNTLKLYSYTKTVSMTAPFLSHFSSVMSMRVRNVITNSHYHNLLKCHKAKSNSAIITSFV